MRLTQILPLIGDVVDAAGFPHEVTAIDVDEPPAFFASGARANQFGDLRPVRPSPLDPYLDPYVRRFMRLMCLGVVLGTFGWDA